MKEELIINGNKTFKIVLPIIALIILAIIFVCSLKPETPDVEQLKNDFISERIDSVDTEITNFEIESETDGKDDIYKAIVNVTYNNDTAEFSRQYHFLYNKYDKWVLENIKNYKEENWTIVPIVAPNIEDFKSECSSMLFESDMVVYDVFNVLHDKTTYSLEEGTATFVFEVEKKSKVINIVGEVEFDFFFDFDLCCWRLIDFTHSDSFSTVYDFNHTWSGEAIQETIGSFGGPMGNTPLVKNASFSIDEYNEGFVKGTLTLDGVEYSVSGDANEKKDDTKLLTFRKLLSADETLKLEGSINNDGDIVMVIYTNYDGNSVYYSRLNMYNANWEID